MLNHSSDAEAACSATYLSDYIECLECLPENLQRHVSEIRRVDYDYYDCLNKIQDARNDIVALNNVAGSLSNELSPDVFRRKRFAIFKQLKYLLLRSQLLADFKLSELACVSDLIDFRTHQLEQDSKNIEFDKVENGGSRNSSNVESARDRPVRSIMRGIMRGEKDRFSGLLMNDERVDRPCNNVTMAFGSEVESETASPSTSSSAAADIGAGAVTRPNKRPRRQKQFPDFVRSEHELAIASAAAETATSTPVTRSGKDRSSNGSIKRKKRQKPEIPSTPVAGNGGGNNKIKFNMPVDPDEPTYCLCEQVSYGEMIGCDNGDCDIEWFHFNCVGLTSKPKGKWYCPNCRGDRPNIMKQSNKNTF